MTIEQPDKPKDFIKDLADFISGDSIHFVSTAKNLDRLKNLDLKNIWLIGANDKELTKILKLVNPTYLNLYQVLIKDLTVLESLNKTETIILNWNTKATKLWDISKNEKLKTLEITDFSKINDMEQLQLAKHISSLTISGGHGKAMTIKTLQPLSSLTNLRYLGLSNLKIEDDSLRALGELKNLEELEISNQFETKEYAWLSNKLKNTKCKMFQATNSCNIVGTDNKTVWDTMVTGRKKPFLSSSKDSVKIEKYRRDFELLKREMNE